MALATISSTTNRSGSALTMNAATDSSTFATDDALGVSIEPGPAPQTTAARPDATEKSDTERSSEPGGDFAALLASLLASPIPSTVPTSPSAEVAPADTRAVSEAGGPEASETRARSAEPESDAPIGRRPAELQAVEIEQQFAGLSTIAMSILLPTAMEPKASLSLPDDGVSAASKIPVAEVPRTQSFDVSKVAGSPTPELSVRASSSTNVSVQLTTTISTAVAGGLADAGADASAGAGALPPGTLTRSDDTRGLATDADRQSLAFVSPGHSTDLAALSSPAAQQPTAATTNRPPQDEPPAPINAPTLTSPTPEEVSTSIVRALTVAPTPTPADDADDKTSPGGPLPVTIGSSVARTPPIPESRLDTRSSENTLVANIASATPHAAKPSPDRAEMPPSNADVATAVPVSPSVASVPAGNFAMAAGRSPAPIPTAGVAAASIASPCELADQLVTSAHRFRGVDGSHQMSLELNPTDLGSVSIRLTVEGSTISMQMNAERAATGDLLRSSLAELRSSLSNGGLTAGNLSVGQHSMSNGAQTGQQSPHPDFERNSSSPSTLTEGMDARSNSAAQRLRAVSNRTGGSPTARLDLQL